jgi:uncharacterized protein
VIHAPWRASPSQPPHSELAPTTITMWGPAEVKRLIGAGWRHIVLGFLLVIVFSIVFAAGAAFIATWMLGDGATAEEQQAAATMFVTLTGPGLMIGLAALWSGLLTAVMLAARAHPGGFRALVGGGFKPKVDIALGVSIGAGIQGFVILLSWLLTLAGVDLAKSGNAGSVTGMTGIWLPLAVLAATVGAPIVEELFFRGLFLHVAIKQVGTVGGVLLSSVAFGLMHTQGDLTSSLYTVTATSLVGVVLAVIRLRTGRISAAIAAHIAFNTVGVALALTLGGQ